MKSAHNFIFLRDYPIGYGRVAKVANTSIKSVLRDLIGAPTGSFKVTNDAFWARGTDGASCLLKNSDAAVFRKTHFIFTFVRNPFSRLVSCYNNKFIKNTEMFGAFRELGFKSGMRFEQFLDRVAEIPDEEADNHFSSQFYALTHNDKPIPHFIGYYERFDRDWERLIKRLSKRGLPTLKTPPKKNVTRGVHGQAGRDYFRSDRLVDLVHRRYARDLELFYSDWALDDLISES